MIRETDVFYIGKISRFRGIRGEVELLFTDDAFDRGDCPYLVLDMEGILVPFFWDEYRFKNADTAIIKFDDIDDEQSARRLVGHRVLYPKAAVPADNSADGELRSLQAFTGFSVSDVRSGRELGVVSAVDDSTENVLIYIDTPEGDELILPLHDDFLVSYSATARTLVLDVPEALLELNA